MAADYNTFVTNLKEARCALIDAMTHLRRAEKAYTPEDIPLDGDRYLKPADWSDFGRRLGFLEDDIIGVLLDAGVSKHEIDY